MRASTREESLATFDGMPVPYGRDGVVRPYEEEGRLVVEVSEHGLVAAAAVGATEPQVERYALAYFLGRRTIEQHLAVFPDGRLQALPVGYDVIGRDWFDIFQDDPRSRSDWGHWTNPGMTANSECLFCHTTGFEKRYDVERNSYDTRWAEMAVGCEGCHGPGSGHVSAARGGEPEALRYALDEPAMLDTCASCHSVRREIWSGFDAGERFLDYFDPVLIDEPAYHADGQLLGESYEWASFLQSRMYREGVTCNDCHEPHGAALRREGDALCLGCHDQRLATPEHTHHLDNDRGARCAGCHMPEHVFMARDRRRDHSFSIPDPQLTVEAGIPNACTDCHAAEAPQWAAQHFERWYGDTPERMRRRELAKAFAAARAGDHVAVPVLLDCLESCPDVIRRAASAKLLARFAEDPVVAARLSSSSTDRDPLVATGVMHALAAGSSSSRGVLSGLRRGAGHPVRAVRVAAAWGLRDVEWAGAAPDVRSSLEAAIAEWLDSQRAAGERPESHHAMGLFYSARGELELAEGAYRQALRIAPGSVPARHNLAMLLARMARRREAIDELGRVLEGEPRFAPGLYMLGRLLRREGLTRDAIAALTDCLKVQPDYPGALRELAHAYVEYEQAELADYVLRAALEHPQSREEALLALVAVHLAQGEREAAVEWARRAVSEFPHAAHDERVAELLGAPSSQPGAG